MTHAHRDDWFNIRLFQKRVSVCVNKDLLEKMLELKEGCHSRLCGSL